MINLEQVKLLETKVAKAIDYVDRLAKENAVLHRQESELHAKMESYQKRIDELEVLVTGFKNDQDRIEEGILSALDRLSQFEKAMEKTLRDKPAGKVAKEAAAAKPQAPAQQAEDAGNSGSGEGQTCFEIPEAAAEGDVPDPLNTQEQDNNPGGELDIF
jgi:peptidoglycan hydrolase CwlO-like protein